jgi:hypothetical protein
MMASFCDPAFRVFSPASLGWFVDTRFVRFVFRVLIVRGEYAYRDYIPVTMVSDSSELGVPGQTMQRFLNMFVKIVQDARMNGVIHICGMVAVDASIIFGEGMYAF